MERAQLVPQRDQKGKSKELMDLYRLMDEQGNEEAKERIRSELEGIYGIDMSEAV